MPYEYCPPKLFMRFRGRKIYHTYKNDSINDPLFYWYTTDVKEDPDFSFDIRDTLKEVKKAKGANAPECNLDNSEHHAYVLREAILLDLLGFPDVDS